MILCRIIFYYISNKYLGFLQHLLHYPQSTLNYNVVIFIIIWQKLIITIRFHAPLSCKKVHYGYVTLIIHICSFGSVFKSKFMYFSTSTATSYVVNLIIIWLNTYKRPIITKRFHDLLSCMNTLHVLGTYYL